MRGHSSDARELDELRALDAGQRRTMTCVSPPPHPARLQRKLSRPKLTVVAKLAADFPLRYRLSAVAAGALCRIPEAITAPTRHSSIEMVDYADALSTQRAL